MATISNRIDRNNKTVRQQCAIESTKMIDSMTKICNRMGRNDKIVWTQYAIESKEMIRKPNNSTYF